MATVYLGHTFHPSPPCFGAHRLCLLPDLVTTVLPFPGNESLLSPRLISVKVSPSVAYCSIATHGTETKSYNILDVLVKEADSRNSISGNEKPDVAEEMFLPPGAIVTDEKPLRRLPGSNIYLGPDAKDGRVKQAEFVKDSTNVADCPKDGLPEFALVGRSNVGKSSLVNTLVQRKELAKTSKKPGKTQVIGHYLINKSWYLVDLPGYGYAKVPIEVRSGWNNFTKGFFLRSKSLVCVMVLVDASIPPQQIDLEFADWLCCNKIPVTIIFTKCDRKKKRKNGGRKPEENLRDFLILLKKSYGKMPPWIMTSCVTNQGKDELLMHIAQMRNYWRK